MAVEAWEIARRRRDTLQPIKNHIFSFGVWFLCVIVKHWRLLKGELSLLFSDTLSMHMQYSQMYIKLILMHFLAETTCFREYCKYSFSD